MIASKLQMILVLRGMIGDKLSYHNPLWYSDEELTDKLELALLRHKPNLVLEQLPRTEIMILCYRAAIDLCHELAARNAPFSVNSIEGMTVDKSGVMNNWIQLSDRYKDFYLTELNGGLGAEGLILQGDFTRFSMTTGRKVPYIQVAPLPPATVYISSVSGRVVTLMWDTTRDSDFFRYGVQRRSSVTGAWTEIVTIYDLQTTNYTDTLTVAGTYDYRIDVVRGTAWNRTIQYPFNPVIPKELITEGNIVTISVV